jgi:hypothetical protein
MIEVIEHIASGKEQEELFIPYLDKAEKSFPNAVFFLEEDFIMDNGRFAGLDENILIKLVACAEKIKSDPALKHFIWLCYTLLCKSPEYPDGYFKSWPESNESLANAPGLFYMLPAIAGVYELREKHKETGIPEDIAILTASDVKVHSDTHSQAKCKNGISPKSLGWFRNWISGNLYRIGRLQYMAKPFRGDIEVYRSKSSGEIVALSGEGIEFNESGYNPVKEKFNEESAWTSRLFKTGNTIKGNPILPCGRALQDEIELDKNLWECAADKDTQFLDVHIPAGGGMSPETCKESMISAVEFFKKFFPEKSISGFQCISWIFNPEFEEMLDENSNLVRFQRELHLFPVENKGTSGVDRVFGTADINPATAPRISSLQRAMLDRLEQGKPIRSGGMFFLKEHLKYFGTNYYREKSRINKK